MTEQQPGEPEKRRRGRPRKSQAERDQERQRRIPPSYAGRMKFLPGDKHALDVEFKEARNLRALIIEEIAQIQAELLDFVGQEQDPGEAISREENALKAYLWETYKEHKHREHILAAFLAIRRRRLYARLQAAHTALEIAQDLLTPDDTILTALRRALHQGPSEATDEAAEDEEAEERSDQGEGQPPERVAKKHIYGDAEGIKQQLDTFNERVKSIRSTITAGNGWFEEFWVSKARMTREAWEYIRSGRPIPSELEMWEIVMFGPYLKYRWREGGSRAYTISMGRIPESMLEFEKALEQYRAEHPEEEEDGGPHDPWPHL